MIGTDIILFFFLNLFLLGLAVLGFQTKREFGLAGILIGLVCSVYVYFQENLIMNSFYDPSTSSWQYSYIPVGYYVWVPIILTFICVIALAEGKR